MPPTVIESHHSHEIIPILMGKNYGKVIELPYVSWGEDVTSTDEEITLLKALAKKYNYRVSKIKQ